MDIKERSTKHRTITDSHTKLVVRFTKKNFLWQYGVEADIRAKNVPVYVVNPIGSDAKSENVPMTQNWVKAQPGAK